jgi:tetrahydromethanopterin S-methyltransferase subunit G
MADLSTLARAAKRVTMDDIYVSLDALKDQQAEDSRHVNQRIDTVSQRVDNLGSQLNQRIDSLGSQVNQRIDQLSQKIDTQIGEVRQEIGQLNRRFDTVLQMLLDLSKQISSQKSQ